VAELRSGNFFTGKALDCQEVNELPEVFSFDGLVQGHEIGGANTLFTRLAEKPIFRVPELGAEVEVEMSREPLLRFQSGRYLVHTTSPESSLLDVLGEVPLHFDNLGYLLRGNLARTCSCLGPLVRQKGMHLARSH